MGSSDSRYINKPNDFTPRQVEFLKYYTEKTSETYNNAYRSALKAGYSENYASNLTDKGLSWLVESVGDNVMLHKAERNINEFLDDKEDKKVKADMTKFVASRLNKRKWGEKIEVDAKITGQFSFASLLDEIKQEDEEIKQAKVSEVLDVVDDTDA